MAKISIIQGPNLNLLGTREPHIYGHTTLDEIHENLRKLFGTKHQLEFFQSNHEGDLIDAIHGAIACDGLVINPGAYAHTSYAIRDALSSIAKPAMEVHLTNLSKRESFRHTSVTAPACIGHIAGLGAYGYELAMLALLNYLG
ncbi:MAG: type II 3-dehydroquinate dehydratase [Myxococcota bacterium]